MAVEIERRFLVSGDSWKKLRMSEAVSIVQGYLAKGDSFVVRVRTADNLAKLTLKSKKQVLRHLEYEYSIPVQDAEEMLRTVPRDQRIEKKRYHILHEGFLWEVDEFSGENAGLCIAEVELQAEDEQIPIPDWVDQEITQDDSYSNFSLSRLPYNKR